MYEVVNWYRWCYCWLFLHFLISKSRDWANKYGEQKSFLYFLFRSFAIMNFDQSDTHHSKLALKIFRLCIVGLTMAEAEFCVAQHWGLRLSGFCGLLYSMVLQKCDAISTASALLVVTVEGLWSVHPIPPWHKLYKDSMPIMCYIFQILMTQAVEIG